MSDLMNEIRDIRDQLNDVIVHLSQEACHVMTASEIVSLCRDEQKVVQTPIWVEDDGGNVWAAVLDHFDDHICAVFGVDLSLDFKDYEKTWIAWNKNPLLFKHPVFFDEKRPKRAV